MRSNLGIEGFRRATRVDIKGFIGTNKLENGMRVAPAIIRESILDFSV